MGFESLCNVVLTLCANPPSQFLRGEINLLLLDFPYMIFLDQRRVFR